jgi:hypothetical protein
VTQSSLMVKIPENMCVSLFFIITLVGHNGPYSAHFSGTCIASDRVEM